jgi:Amt family ammonium transporter
VAAVLTDATRDTTAGGGGRRRVRVVLRGRSPGRHGRRERLRERLATSRFEWEDRLFSISASVGLVPITGTQTPAVLLASADAACYAAKDHGRNRVQVYAPEDSELAARQGEMLWTPEIMRALDEGRLALYHQRIAPLSTPPTASRTTRCSSASSTTPGGSCRGGVHPRRRALRLMRRIDQWVLATAIAHLGVRHAGAAQPVELCAINLSATSVSDPLLGLEIEALLDEHQVPGAALCFEITETSAIANLDTARALIAQLRARGCRFALDDFGRGLSSFGYLRELPVDIVKIDGSFVRSLGDDDVSEAIVRAVHHVAGSIGAQTVAEFVENDRILERVRALGIDYAQGYAVGRRSPCRPTVRSRRRRRPGRAR